MFSILEGNAIIIASSCPLLSSSNKILVCASLIPNSKPLLFDLNTGSTWGSKYGAIVGINPILSFIGILD